MSKYFIISILLFSLLSCEKDPIPENTINYNQTINGYTLTQNETWSGKILLKGDIVVPAGITLTINPGTIIYISTDAPIYDNGFETGKIDFDVFGNLIINGTAQNIVQIIPNATSSWDLPSWDGINMSGNRLEMNYCFISDSQNGVFCFSSSTAIKINHCFFNNISCAAIVDCGSLQPTLTNNSFIKCFEGYDLFKSNRISQIDNSEFKDNSIDIGISGMTSNITNNATIKVNYSNFLENTWYNLYWPPDGGVTNSKIIANNCYGITTYLNKTNGNSYTYLNQLLTPNLESGCGFSSMAKFSPWCKQ